jgi:hypothetical protein
MWDLWWTKWHWGRFSVSTWIFFCQFAFHRLLHSHHHHHLSSGRGTIGRVVSFSPHPKKLNKKKDINVRWSWSASRLNCRRSSSAESFLTSSLVEIRDSFLEVESRFRRGQGSVCLCKRCVCCTVGNSVPATGPRQHSVLVPSPVGFDVK